jgi:hypothetical protein
MKVQLFYHNGVNEFLMGEFSSKKEAKGEKKLLEKSHSGKFRYKKIS